MNLDQESAGPDGNNLAALSRIVRLFKFQKGPGVRKDRQVEESKMPDSPIELAAAGMALPALEGSAREVGLAEPVRLHKLVQADDVMSRLRENDILAKHDQDPSLVGGPTVRDAQEALGKLRHETSAQWWINHAEIPAADLLIERVRSVVAEQD